MAFKSPPAHSSMQCLNKMQENQFSSLKSLTLRLLVRSVHERQLHAGVGSTVVALRKRFWLPSTRSETARVLKQCVTCRYQIGGVYKLPHSPPLPDFRPNMVKLFSTVGIDFTSHLMVNNGNKKEKCYVCLFTCSTTHNGRVFTSGF